MTTKIAWTEETWNPVTGCSKVSPGCANCYAEAIDRRFNADVFQPWLPENAEYNVQTRPERLDAPLHWRNPRRVFVNSMSDLFHEQVPDEFIDRVFAVMAICGGTRQLCAGGSRCQHEDYGPKRSRGCWHHGDGVEQPIHTFQILTKRPERMRDYVLARTEWRGGIEEALNDPAWGTTFEMPELIMEDAGWPLRNVWLGVSVENQHWADERIPLLLQTPAAVRFLSCEPMLEAVDLAEFLYYETSELDAPGRLAPRIGIHWVIVGGESGRARRPFELQWARSLRDQCRDAGVAFFFKQAGALRSGTPSGDPELDSCKEYPEAR